MHIAIRPVLRAHVIQVIARGECAPSLEDVLIARGVGGFDGLLQLIGNVIPGGPASRAWRVLDRGGCRDCGGDLRDGAQRATLPRAA